MDRCKKIGRRPTGRSIKIGGPGDFHGDGKMPCEEGTVAILKGVGIGVREGSPNHRQASVVNQAI